MFERHPEKLVASRKKQKEWYEAQKADPATHELMKKRAREYARLRYTEPCSACVYYKNGVCRKHEKEVKKNQHCKYWEELGAFTVRRVNEIKAEIKELYELVKGD